MRFLTTLFITVLFFFCALFLLQNKEVLAIPMTLGIDLFFIDRVESIELPYYFLVLCAFVVGAFSTFIYLLLGRLSLGSSLRQARKQVKVLTKELEVVKANFTKELEGVRADLVKAEELNAAYEQKTLEAKPEEAISA
ncbi:lipopolysaccharide assembly protein LapA domain-containing protein [Desulfovibrio litoralis]|uniref:Uncharacterized protein n=1 Tax=Desulfovibrio litoralis DSM 11393 TaxID=1121455 RepID=A0A1M7TAQ9_9BACT|nr:lipopolysaccharide assembly protein LapA domain-containing protein [Desulfovibrio litoralis]SHN67788.1 Protein of unknown function [Desulfovibrio litoralis DSM 11393]